MNELKLSGRLAVILCDRSRRDPAMGICSQWSVDRDDLSRGLMAWADARPGCSWVYPVVGGKDAYREAMMNKGMWRGAYGNERKELLRFLIRYYRERGQ